MRNVKEEGPSTETTKALPLNPLLSIIGKLSPILSLKTFRRWWASPPSIFPYPSFVSTKKAPIKILL